MVDRDVLRKKGIFDDAFLDTGSSPVPASS